MDNFYYYELLIIGPFDNYYTYKSEEKLAPGQVALVHLKSRLEYGVVIKKCTQSMCDYDQNLCAHVESGADSNCENDKKNKNKKQNQNLLMGDLFLDELNNLSNKEDANLIQTTTQNTQNADQESENKNKNSSNPMPCADKKIRIKKIIKAFDYVLKSTLLDFLNWVANYTLNSRGWILKMIISETKIFTAKREIPTKKIEFINDNSYEKSVQKLTTEQKKALQAIEQSTKNTIVLEGITGSGKTEVFLAYARKILESNKQVLILMPEIALTKQICDKIKENLGIEPFIWNSSISEKNKKITWKNICTLDSGLVIGARSALFLPFKNLGLIVLDEEHDQSYKQDETTIYNARDMAIVKANIENCKIILASATISLETNLNIELEKYDHTYLSSRFFDVKMPKILLIDTKLQNKNLGIISPQLHQEILCTLEKKQQIMLFLNKRGYAPVAVCTNCYMKKTCMYCSTNLVYHKKNNILMCHYCGYMLSLDGNAKCNNCKSENFIFYGLGIEQIYEEAKQKFPNANILLASSDTFKTKKSMEESIKKIQNLEIDIIIATQILSKGHHFKNLTLVGVLNADAGLFDTDIRAIEKTFQTLIQVSGRCGREIDGQIMIQTTNPEHYIFNSLINYDINGFIKQEKQYRLQAQYPPYTKFVAIIFSGYNFDEVEKDAKNFMEIKKYINSFLQYSEKKNANKTTNLEEKNYIEILGPVISQIAIVNSKIRWRVLIKCNKNCNIQYFLKHFLNNFKKSNSVQIQIDVDPINFL